LSKKKSSSAREIAELVAVVIIVVGIVLGVNFGLQIALGTSTPTVVVSSRSMEPTINIGDICIIQRIPAEQYIVGNHTMHTGDVVVWNATGIVPTENNEPIIHRIVARRYNNLTKHYEFLTEGDNNHDPDHWPDSISHLAWFEDTRIYGKVIYTIPWVGNIILFLRKGGYWILIAALAVIIVLVFISETHKIDEEVKEKLNPNSSSMVS
jgi:signal peptidase I